MIEYLFTSTLIDRNDATWQCFGISFKSCKPECGKLDADLGRWNKIHLACFHAVIVVIHFQIDNHSKNTQSYMLSVYKNKRF